MLEPITAFIIGTLVVVVVVFFGSGIDLVELITGGKSKFSKALDRLFRWLLLALIVLIILIFLAALVMFLIFD